MRHLRVLCLFLPTSSVLAFGQNTQSLEAQQQTKMPFIEHIEICCPRRVQLASVRRFILSRTGAMYCDEAVQRDVVALRDSGFFFDVRANILDSPDNQKRKIVAFDVREKPIIRRIVYKGIKSIPESDIASASSYAKVRLSAGTWFDQNELAHGATVIKELLAARGWPSLPMKDRRDRSSGNVITRAVLQPASTITSTGTCRNVA